jgi:hypothetical protein
MKHGTPVDEVGLVRRFNRFSFTAGLRRLVPRPRGTTQQGFQSRRAHPVRLPQWAR